MLFQVQLLEELPIHCSPLGLSMVAPAYPHPRLGEGIAQANEERLAYCEVYPRISFVKVSGME